MYKEEIENRNCVSCDFTINIEEEHVSQFIVTDSETGEGYFVNICANCGID